MNPSLRQRPVCPACGDPIGAYEPIWRVSPVLGGERTAWLHLPNVRAPLESLWHAACAEEAGVDGG